MDEVNAEINHMKSLLKEVKKEEQKSEDILQIVKYAKYLRQEVTITKKQTKFNYNKEQKIWIQLKNGTKFQKFINKITI